MSLVRLWLSCTALALLYGGFLWAASAPREPMFNAEGVPFKIGGKCYMLRVREDSFIDEGKMRAGPMGMDLPAITAKHGKDFFVFAEEMPCP